MPSEPSGTHEQTTHSNEQVLRHALREQGRDGHGGASGIGAALVKALAERGARVILMDLDEVQGRRVANSLRSAPGSVEVSPLDVRDLAAFRRIADAVIERHGRVDFLFNNAGAGIAGEVRDATEGDWELAINVNLWGVIHGVQAVYPHMVTQRSGCIINTSSGAGLLPRPGMVPYATAKHGVTGLSLSLRAEAAGLGVRVHAVCPGFIETQILKSTTFRNLDPKRLTGRLPIRGMQPDRCVEHILRGIEKNRAVIPITRLTKVEWLLFRLNPDAMTRVMSLRARVFRSSRLTR